jgi:hypothetical protein
VRWIAAAAVVACSAPAPPVVAPEPAPVVADARVPDAERDEVASYGGERCKVRVEAMTRRFAEAQKAMDLDRQNAELPTVAGQVDGFGVDLSRDVLSVTVRIANGPPQVWIGDKELRLTGETWFRQIGRAAMRGDREYIDLWLQMPSYEGDVRPLVVELAGQGKLRLMVRVVIPSRMQPLLAELPARVQRFDAANRDELLSFLPASGCVALDEALKDPAAIWTRAPAAILACDCAKLDVDAIEAWVLLSQPGFSFQLGWLAIAIDPKGTPVSTTGTALDLAAMIGALSPDDRARGIRFEPRRPPK